MPPKNDRAFKERLYGQFARIGKALASPHRIEIIELLAQGERSVEALAHEAGVPIANASQHLKVLRQAGMVESRKVGLFVLCRLADEAVIGLAAALRLVAERRLADLERVLIEHFGDRHETEPVELEELRRRIKADSVVVLDTRPALEYAAGHIPGAISIPIDELPRRLARLPKGKAFVAYCRGPYCVYADRAVGLLVRSGRRAQRLREGFPEWRAAGLPVAAA